jgi:hypothetical protein
LPDFVSNNEKWTGPKINDTPNNWRRGYQGVAQKVNPADMKDKLSPGGWDTAAPQPVRTRPQNPLGDVKVMHWKGEWRIGSIFVGHGVLVQKCTWQYYQDHARHEDIVSPP